MIASSNCCPLYSKIYYIFSEFNRYLLIFSKKRTKINLLTVCEIFFKLEFSKFIQNTRTLESFGKFLIIVRLNMHIT